MNYDEAIKRLDEIVHSMEADQALSMEQYKQKAAEAKQLIELCQKQLKNMQTEFEQALKN